ncbi:C-type lectin domain family 4 member M [Acanthochromis polyacanthus]|uniref:C-type lectin domain family 4 member M n=1 Tax=Acanthochromis polyacanthus TaxID=80966 RepID=UPI00223437CA|nr:C-type lectin domain family 4 member M [Acanthochromis polyacanthus]
MEEEVNYTTVIFNTNETTTTLDKPNNMEVVYEEVKTQEQELHPVRTENKKETPFCILPTLVVAGFGMICIILMSVVIALGIHFTWEYRENVNLQSQNWQLKAEKAALQRRTEELARERDRLNWTIGFILEYEDFPVKTRCPQKVCKPCLDGWVWFQSSCYWFSTAWRFWESSRDDCRKNKAYLVVIGSQEEQEFISNHTDQYYDKTRGYWLGLKYKDKMNTWTWVDGSNSTVMYWIPEQDDLRESCALNLKRVNPLESWQKTTCTIKNRWICETKALIRSD